MSHGDGSDGRDWNLNLGFIGRTEPLLHPPSRHIGRYANRLSEAANNPREVAFAAQWERENELGERCSPDAFSTAEELIGRRLDGTSCRDLATIIQWLGSNVGFSFLQEALKRCGYRIVPVKDL